MNRKSKGKQTITSCSLGCMCTGSLESQMADYVIPVKIKPDVRPAAKQVLTRRLCLLLNLPKSSCTAVSATQPNNELLHGKDFQVTIWLCLTLTLKNGLITHLLKTKVKCVLAISNVLFYIP